MTSETFLLLAETNVEEIIAATHLEDADLVGRAEAVFDRAQDAIGVVPVAFEVEDGIDDVLEHARPGDGSRLRHVPDEERGYVHAFGEVHQRRGALAHLADRPRRGLDFIRIQRLNDGPMDY